MRPGHVPDDRDGLLGNASRVVRHTSGKQPVSGAWPPRRIRRITIESGWSRPATTW